MTTINNGLNNLNSFLTCKIPQNWSKCPQPLDAQNNVISFQIKQMKIHYIDTPCKINLTLVHFLVLYNISLKEKTASNLAPFSCYKLTFLAKISLMKLCVLPESTKTMGEIFPILPLILMVSEALAPEIARNEISGILVEVEFCKHLHPLP